MTCNRILSTLLLLATPLAAQWGADSHPTRTTADHTKRVIGYVTQWDAWKSTDAGLPKQGFLNHLNLDYSQYTHLNFSFFGVANDGSLHSGDYRNQNIYQPGTVQSPAPLLHGDIYSSWDYHLVWGQLTPQWEINATSLAAGFVAFNGGWKHSATGLSGPMPVPYHPPGTAPGIIELAHSNGVKVMAAVGGWSMCRHFPEMAADPVKRARFIADCQKLIALGFDGIDFDWEYPGAFAGMNFTGSNADYANFLTLITELRAAIGPNKEITSAMSAAPAKLAGFNWPAVSSVLDSIDLMTYDIQGGWSDIAGHNSPLHPYPGEEGGALAADTAVQYLLAQGVPASKLALGLAFYGRGVVCSTAAALHAPTVKISKTIQPDGPIITAADFATWGPFDATPTYEFIHQKISNGWTRHWDDVAKVPYLTKGTSFLSYDDSRSIGHKAAYVRQLGLGGVIIWHAYGDLRAGTITNPSDKLPFSPTTDAPLVNVVNSVLAGDAIPADGTEGPSPVGGPPRGLTTLPARPLVTGYLNALRNANGQDQVIADVPAAVHAANLEAFDMVITAFAEPMADGSIGTGLGAFASYLPAVVSEGHSLGKSVVVSIGGAYPASLADRFAAIAASPALRQTFANNVAAFLAAHQLDGVDIDYEFPSDASARANFTLLMQTLHATVKAADSRYIVMFGGGPGWYLGSFDFTSLHPFCDFFFYFGYDWKNPANGPLRKPGSTQWTSANDQLPEASVKGGLDYVLGKGFPANKILCGLPFYGSNNRSWSAVRNLWTANASSYTAAIDADSLEVRIDGEWFTPPDAMKRKMSALLSSADSVLAGGAVIRGVGCWEIGHEHASHPDLSTAFSQWIANATAGPATVSVSGGSVSEGDFGSKSLSFTVTLSRVLETPASVNFATVSGTAIAGNDFAAQQGNLVFAPGETSKTVAITILGDETVETDEQFSLTLSAASGVAIATATATGSILNDDTAAPGGNEGWIRHALQGGLTLTLSVSSDWGSGFQGVLRLTNKTGAALPVWTIQFDAPFTVSSMSDGVYGGKTGSTHTVSNPTWVGYSLANGTTGIIDFIGAGTQTQPANLKLNGQPVGSSGSTFASWSASQNISGASGDPDGDGRPNFIEFLNGSMPKSADAGHRIERRTLMVGGVSQTWFCIIVPATRTAADVEYRVTASATPSFQTSRLMVLHETVDLGNNRLETVWRDTAPLSNRPRSFARIEARSVP